MPRKISKKKTVEPKAEVAAQEPAVLTAEEPAIVEESAVYTAEESAAKKEFRKTIEAYKTANPAKYAQKEAELLAKLNQL